VSFEKKYYALIDNCFKQLDRFNKLLSYRHTLSNDSESKTLYIANPYSALYFSCHHYLF